MPGDRFKINPITGKLDLVALETDQTTDPSNGDILQYNSTTALWEFISFGSGTLGNLILEEVPSGTINGVNKTFTLANNVSLQKIIVYLNGVRLERITTASRIDQFQHVSGSAVITLGTAPTITGDGDYLVVTYIKS